MKFEDMKNLYVGQRLLNIIDLNLNESNRKVLGNMTNDDYSSIESASLLLFDNNQGLLFVDYDCDGYRSGDWHLVTLKALLDKGQTKGIKKINSVVKDIEYFNNSNEVGILITTDEYVIKMGQDSTDSYYPKNFFSVKECKAFALGEVVEMPLFEVK